MLPLVAALIGAGIGAVSSSQKQRAQRQRNYAKALERVAGRNNEIEELANPWAGAISGGLAGLTLGSMGGGSGATGTPVTDTLPTDIGTVGKTSDVAKEADILPKYGEDPIWKSGIGQMSIGKDIPDYNHGRNPASTVNVEDLSSALSGNKCSVSSWSGMNDLGDTASNLVNNPELQKTATMLAMAKMMAPDQKESQSTPQQMTQETQKPQLDRSSLDALIAALGAYKGGRNV